MLYNDHNSLWRQHLILGEVAYPDRTMSRIFAVLTPDGDMYVEDSSGQCGHVVAVRFADHRRHLPAGIPPNRVYKFKGDSSDVELLEIKALGEQSAAEWWAHQAITRARGNFFLAFETIVPDTPGPAMSVKNGLGHSE